VRLDEGRWNGWLAAIRHSNIPGFMAAFGRKNFKGELLAHDIDLNVTRLGNPHQRTRSSTDITRCSRCRDDVVLFDAD